MAFHDDDRLTRGGDTLRLLVSGGGTGGHVYPALTAVGALRRGLDGRALEVLWVGAHGSLEARVAAAEGIEFAAVATGKLRRDRNPLKMLSAANLRDMCRVPLGVWQARSLVRSFRPDVVLSTGGYVALPVGMAAHWCRRPLVVHEQTVRLGLANRLLARAATTVAVSSASTLDLLPGSARRSAQVTGNPVRPSVLAGDGRKAVAALGLDGFDLTLPTVYVTGGAQGSAQINSLVGEILPWLLERANVIHQCGPAHADALKAGVEHLPPELAGRYLVAGFVGSELPDVLALAEVMISRSGAGTIAEITALGKAAVLIPLVSSAGNEQAHNARHLADAGAAVALCGTVTPEDLRTALGPLLADAGARAVVAENAKQLGRPDAAELLAQVLLDAAG